MPNSKHILQQIGFRVWRGRPGRMPDSHAHADVEWNYVLQGSVRYLLGGRFATLSAGSLGVFWAGVPHRLIELGKATQIVWVTVPLAWVMHWELGDRFIRALLSGEMIKSSDDLDRPMLTRWSDEFRRAGDNAQKIVMLEVEARLRRLAAALAPRARAAVSDDQAPRVEQIASFVAGNFREIESVRQIAAAVDLHPNYAMQLFKRTCGLPLWEYVTRLRVSHAQRLLLTTDWKVTQIAMESGFASAGRFYDSFARIVGKTPREYRTFTRT